MGNPLRVKRASDLPSRGRMAVDSLDGALDLYEADHRIFLNVTQEDIDPAICDDPKHCAAANSAKRMYAAIAVDFHRTIAYIVWPGGRGPYKGLKKDYAVRYTMPAETMKQVATFDTKAGIVPCQLDFLAVTAGRTLRARRATLQRYRASKNPKHISARNMKGPRGGHHYITGFIGVQTP